MVRTYVSEVEDIEALRVDTGYRKGYGNQIKAALKAQKKLLEHIKD